MSLEKDILLEVRELVQAVGDASDSESGADHNNATTTQGERASLVVKAGPGKLYFLTVYNNNAGAQWIQLHDSATLPANGAIPVVTFEIATQVARTLDYGVYGRKFANGIVVCNSTTDVTKTIGAADIMIDCQFE